MTEREIQDQWGQILPHLDRYERAFIISDDARPRPHALKLLRGLMDDGHPVVTGYCNLAADDFRANLTYTPLRIPISTRSYDLYTIAQVKESQTITVPTFYTGFCLTGMSTELWRKYPYMVETEGADHMAADFNLSRRLEADGVPIGAHREAFIWHVNAVNTMSIGDGSKILSGSVVVKDRGTGIPTDPNTDLWVGQNVTTPPVNWVKASRITAYTNTVFGGDLYYNSLTVRNPDGTIASQKNGTLDLSSISAPPAVLPPFASGSVDKSYTNGQVAALGMGTTNGYYGAIDLAPKAVVTLVDPGIYTFQSLWVNANATLHFGASPITIRIVDGFSVENGTFTGPSSASVDASQILLYVAGTGSSRFPRRDRRFRLRATDRSPCTRPGRRRCTAPTGRCRFACRRSRRRRSPCGGPGAAARDGSLRPWIIRDDR